MGKQKIKILGVNYKIEFGPLVLRQSLMGQIDYVNQKIIIDENLSKDKAKIVLIHEIIHAIFEQLGQEEFNEKENLIQLLSTSLYQVVKENQSLLD